MKIGNLVKIINNDMSLCLPEGNMFKSDRFFDAIGLVIEHDENLSKIIGHCYQYWHIVLFSAGTAVVREDVMKVLQ